MFRLLNNGYLLNLMWVDSFELEDNKIKYIMVNGVELYEEFASAQEAENIYEELITDEHEMPKDVNTIEF